MFPNSDGVMVPHCEDCANHNCPDDALEEYDIKVGAANCSGFVPSEKMLLVVGDWQKWKETRYQRYA